MAQRRRTSTYIYGNTARNLDIRRQINEEPRRQLSHEARKNREKAHHMSLGYVVFLIGALAVCAFILINYVQMQSELTNKTKEVAKLESRLNTLKLENDENYNRITSSIDLEEIKRVAIGELGMTYAREGQIITYSNAGNDYMRYVAAED
ncbi:MAG: LapA family protein [Lachnospiraceae bacterium]|nr:LapA family protein [Lachnospiraceae bacterium]